jgi:hypothetical protein
MAVNGPFQFEIGARMKMRRSESQYPVHEELVLDRCQLMF